MNLLRAAMPLLALCCLLFNTNATAREASVRHMVLTFDDLPYQASGHPDSLEQARDVTDRLLVVLASHQAPATAFVNEANLAIEGEKDDRVRLLEQWLDAGAKLGNHTYSHADLNNLTVDEYKREITRGEEITRQLMSSRPKSPRYFRHPFTHTGDTADKKADVTESLAERGYQVAPYTIDSQDSLFNRTYLDAWSSGDRQLAGRIRGSYIDFVMATTAFAEQISVKLFAGEIPQTMIFHANRINADALDDLLERLAGRGYCFIELEKALKHPAYATGDTLVTRYGPSWLWRWNKSLGLDISFRGDPEPPAWVLELYEHAVSANQ